MNISLIEGDDLTLTTTWQRASMSRIWVHGTQCSTATTCHCAAHRWNGQPVRKPADSLGYDSRQRAVSRLCQKGMITPARRRSDDIWSMKSLSTKFVRTWRLKMRDGKPQYLRRRLCAREFRWLDGSREGLFSPATSADIIRLLPVLFLHRKFNPDTESKKANQS